jgi:hypothetical protein
MNERAWYRSRLRREINQKLVTKLFKIQPLAAVFNSILSFFPPFCETLAFFYCFRQRRECPIIFFSSFFILFYCHSLDAHPHA